MCAKKRAKFRGGISAELRSSCTICSVELLVRKCVDGIFAGGFECRIERAEKGPGERDADGEKDPVRCDSESLFGKLRMNQSAEQIRTGDPYSDADDGQQAGLAQDDGDDAELAGAHRFQDADLSRALHD